MSHNIPQVLKLFLLTSVLMDFGEASKCLHFCDGKVPGGLTIEEALSSPFLENAGCIIIPTRKECEEFLPEDYPNMVKFNPARVDYEAMMSPVKVCGPEKINEDCEEEWRVTPDDVTVDSSMGLCTDYSRCPRLRAEVFRFELFSCPSNAMREPIRRVKVAEIPHTHNKPPHMVESYNAVTFAKESLDIGRVKEMRSMPLVFVSPALQVEASPELSELIESKQEMLVEGLRNAYTYTTSPETIKRERYSVKRNVELITNLTSTYPKCANYTHTWMVQRIQGYAIDYALHAGVRGYIGQRGLSAVELGNILGDMEFVEAYDENTVIVKGYGTIIADFAPTNKFYARGFIIPECKKKIGQASPAEEEPHVH